MQADAGEALSGGVAVGTVFSALGLSTRLTVCVTATTSQTVLFPTRSVAFLHSVTVSTSLSSCICSLAHGVAKKSCNTEG